MFRFSTWLRRLARGLFAPRGPHIRGRRVRPRRKSRAGMPIRIEKLEDYVLPSSYIVTTTADTGSSPLSLRQAILDANANAGSTIQFNIPTSDSGYSNGSWTITLGSALPQITANTTITGLGASELLVSGNNLSGVFVIHSGATVAISGLTIEDGNATEGGGIDNLGNLTLTDSTVTGNTANYGGGIYSSFATLSLIGTTVSGNTSQYSGAGIWTSYGTATLTNSIVSHNHSNRASGGIVSFGNSSTAGVLTLIDSTVYDNSASSAAGGIGNVTHSTLTLTDSTVTGNTASLYGGGILNSGTLSLTDSTIAGNSGGVWLYNGGTLTLGDTIVSDNTTNSGVDIHGSITTDHGYNLLGTALQGTTSGTGDVFSDTPMLSALGNYGGTTETMMPEPGSPAIGAGNNSGGPSTDQRGFARATGSGGDIGAVEGTYFVVNTTADSDDGSATGATVSLRDAINYGVDAAPGFSFITFSPGLSGGTITLGSSLPTITGSVAITAPSGGLTVSATGQAIAIGSGATVSLAGLTINGDVSDTGTLDLAGYSLSVGALTGSGTVTNSAASGTATLTLNGTGTFGGVIQDGGTAQVALTIAGGTETLTGASTYTGTTTISAGTLQVGNGGTTGSLGAGAVIDNAALLIDLSSTVNVVNAISGTGTVTLTSTGGAITQSAAITAANLVANASTGITLNNAGNAVSSFTATNNTSGNISLTNAAALAVQAAGISQVGTGTVTVANTGALTLSAPVSSSGNGAIVLTASGSDVALKVNANVSGSNAPVTIYATGNLTVGTGVVINSGTAALTLGADLTAGGVGDNGTGTLSINGTAGVYGATITLRGAAENIASTATVGSTGSSPVGTLTGLNDPNALVFDASGNLYVANYGFNGSGTTVSEFAPGATSPSATLIGLSGPIALAFDASGNLYVANFGQGNGTSVSKFAPGGTTPTATLTGLNGPDALAFDASGNLYVANYGGGSNGNGTTVSKFAPGATSPTATLNAGNNPAALAFDASGNLYVANAGDNTVDKFAPGATSPSATLTGLNEPYALAFDASGNLFAANYGSGSGTTISKFAPGATTPTATLTGVNAPYALVFDASGNLFAANNGGTTVNEFAPGATSPSATLNAGSGPAALAFNASGILYVANGTGTTVSEFSPTPTTAVTIQSSVESRPMLIGGTNGNPVAGINLTSAELARLFTTSTGTITFGDSNQTGNITFSTATPATTAGASTVALESSTGAGQIILDDGSGSSTALNANCGAVSLTAGTGGIVEQSTNTSGIADIAGSATSVTLISAGAIGTSGQPVQLNSTSLTTNTSANNSNEFLSTLSTVTATSLNAGTGTINLQAGTFQLGANNAISSSSAVSLANVSGAVLNLDNFNDTIASLAGGGTTGGNVALASATLTTGNSSNTTYSGVISGAAGSILIKQGSGIFTLAGANTYAGATTINAGTLLVNGSITSATTVNSSTTLGGTGTITSNVSNAGTVSPGTVGSAGTLTITGTYTQSSGGTLYIDVGGTSAGSYDVLAITGGNSATLGGTLQVNLVNGFTLSGSTAAIVPLTYGSRSSIFTTLTSQASNGLSFTPNYVAATTSMKLQVEQAGTTVYWVGGNADYNTPADWSTGADPTTTDTADIVSGATVTFSSSDTSQVTGLYVNGTLNVNGGTLTVGTTAGSNFSLTTGGTLGGSGTVNNSTSATDTWAGGTIAGVSLTQSGSGSITIDSGTTVSALGNLTVNTGSLTFNAGLSLPALGSVSLSAGNNPISLTFSTGNAVTVSSLSVFGSNAGGAVATFTGSDTVTVTGTTTVGIQGILSGTGTVVAQGGLVFSAPLSATLVSRTLDNYGTATFNAGNTVGLSSGASIVNEPGATWNQGSGAGFSGGASGSFTNQGTFNNTSGSNTIGVTFSNSGTVNANSGTLILSGTMSQFSSGTLTGGTWEATGGTLRGFSSGITTDAAAIVVSGSGSNIYTGISGSTNALAGLTSITSAGSLSIQNGYILTETASTLTNAGTVTIGGGSTPSTLAGPVGAFTFTQTAGATTVNGTLDPNTVTLSGGTLSGPGTIVANVSNSGATIYPSGQNGLGGTLTITGTYSQSGTGTLDIDVGGTSAGSYDVLAVTGTVSLGGTLAVNFVSGFSLSGATPSIQPLTFASPRTGYFTTLNTPGSNGFYLDPNYASTSMSLVVEGAAATVYWTDGTGNWTTNATSWSTGVVPASTDNVYIPSTGNVTLSSSSTIAGLNVAGTFTLSGGTFTDNGNLQGSGTINWTGGTLGGTITITSGTTVNISNTNNVTLAGTLTNAGTINQTVGASGGTLLFNGSTLNNTGNYYVTLTVGATVLLENNGLPVFNNSGLFELTTGNFTALVGQSVPFNNTGTVEALTGTINLGSGGTSSGTFYANGGNININSNITLNAATTFQSSGTSAVQLVSGSVTANAALTIDNTFNWNGGTIAGTGTTIASGATANIGTTSTNVTLAGTLTNNGTINQTDGTSGGVLILASGTLNNAATYNVTLTASSNVLSESSGTPVFNNSGTFELTTGNFTGTIASGVALDNTGTVEALTGTIQIAGGGTSSGTFNASGGFISFNSSVTLNNPTTFESSGAGAVQLVGGSVTANAALTIDNTFNWNGGTIGGTGTTIASGATANIGTTSNNATLSGTLNNSGTIHQTVGSSGGTVSFSGGTLNNAGTYNVTLTASSTVMSEFSGSPTFNNTGTFALTAASSFTGTIGSGMTVSQVSGSTLTGGTWNMSGGTTLTVSGASLTTISANATVSLSGSSSTFSNLSGLATNNGTFSLTSHTFTASGNFSNAGTLNLQAGGDLSITGSNTFTQTSAGTLGIQLAGTSASQYGVLSVGGLATLAGTLNVTESSFNPAAGNSFQVITFGTRSGDFSTKNLTLADGNVLFANYSSSGLTLVTAPPGTTVDWTDGTGSWSTASDWSTGAVPGSSDVVYIPAAGNVTFSAGSSTIAGLNDAGALTVSGGTFTVNGTVSGAGSFTLSGGTLSNSTFASGTTLTGSGFSATMSGVTVNGTLDLATNNNDIDVTNGLTLNGTTNIGNPSNSSTAGELTFFGTQTLGGTGTINFGYYVQNELFTASSSTLTIGSGLTITGKSGQINGNSPVINYGTINAETSSDTITIQSALPSFTNNGTVEATNGGSLSVAFGATGGNTGSVLATGGGSLTVTGGASVGTFTGFGNLSISGGGTLYINSGNAFGWQNSGTINATGSSAVDLGGTFTQSGLTASGSTFTYAGAVNIVGTLTGGLTLSSNTGSWDLGDPNNSNAGTGTLSGGAFSASGGAALFATFDSALSGMTLNSPIDKSTYNNDVIVLGDLTLNNVTLTLGNPNNTSTAGEMVFESSGTQNLTGTGTIVFGDYVQNTIATASNTTLIIGSGIIIRGQGGQIQGSGPSIVNNGLINDNVSGGNIRTSLGGASAFTNNGTFEGTSGGSINVNFGATGANNGTVQVTGGTLTVTGGSSIGTFSGFGNLSIAGGGTLYINSGNAFQWQNSGSISATGSSAVDLGGTFTQAALTANGSTFTYAGAVNIVGMLTGGLTLSSATGSWNLGDPNNGNAGTGTLSGGTFSTSGGASLFATFDSALSGVTLSSPIDLSTDNNDVTVTNGLTLNNVTLNLGNQSNTNTSGELVFNGTQTLGGTGTINFGFFSNTLFTGSSTTLTVGSGITVQGQTGTIGGNGTVINNGTIDANTSGHTILIDPPTFTNNGTVEAAGGGTVTITPTTLSNFSSGTLTGGTWEATGNSTLRGFASAITKDAATILVSGASSNVYTGSSGTTNALGGLSSVTGSLTIQGGYNLTVTASTLTNTGTVVISSGTTLAGPVNAFTFTQNGGATTVNGTLDPNTVNLNSGTLSGPGTIAANVSNSGGTIYPSGQGGLGGTLTIQGTYSQSSGTLDIDVSGTSAGSYDVLAVTGGATLGGTLQVNLVNGFTLSNSTTAIVPLTYGSRSGTFSTLTSQASNSLELAPNYVGSTTSVSLQVVAPGTTIFWVGGASGSWTTAANWSTGSMPGSSDNVYIGGNVTVSATTVNASYTVKTLYVDTGATLSVSGVTFEASSSTGPQITVNGTVTCVGQTFGLYLQVFSSTGSTSVAGSGTISFNSEGQSAVEQANLQANQSLTIAAGLTITGASFQVGNNYTGDSLVNHATISSTGTTTLFLGSGGTNEGTFTETGGEGFIEGNGAGTSWTNSANVSVSGGGELFLGSDGSSWSNTATIQSAGTNTQVNLSGVFTQSSLGTLSRDSATTIFLRGTLTGNLTMTSSMGVWESESGTLQNGTYTATGTGALTLDPFDPSLNVNNETLDSAIDFSTNGGSLVLINTLTLGPGVNLQMGNPAGGNTGSIGVSNIVTNDAATITTSGGSNTITFGPGSNGGGIGLTAIGQSLTIGAGITIAGGFVQIGSSGQPIYNYGKIEATVRPSSGSAQIEMGSAGVNEAGATIEALNVPLQVDQFGGASGWTNNGTIIASGATLTIGSASDTHPVTNLASGTLTGGTWEALSGGVLAGFASGGITTDAATLVLSGSGAAFYTSGTTSALAGLTAVSSGDSLTIQNSATLTLTATTLANAGTVAIGSSGQLIVANYTQSAGSTVLASGTLDPNNVTLNGGTLSGPGTIDGNLTNNGATIYPGGAGATGILVVQGTFTQNSGTLNIDIGGTTAGTSYDQVQVAGTTTLGGVVNVDLVNSFTTGPSQQFEILTVGSGSSQSATFQYPGGATFYPDLTTSGLYLFTTPTQIVTTNADSGAGSLRQAITNADTTPGTDIVFDPSLANQTITLTSGALPTITANTTITGLGASELFVSGNNAYQVFSIGSGATVSISGMTIEDGLAANANGGAIFNAGDLTLTSSTITGSKATGTHSAGTGLGGGIYNKSSAVATLNYSTISGNTATGFGGGIVNYGGTLSLDGSSVDSNTAPYGGGIFSRAGTLTLTNASIVSDNTASGDAGGIFNFLGTATLTDTTVSGNMGAHRGGGIYSRGTMSVTDSTVSGNTSYDGGGGIENKGGLSLTDSTISGNRTRYDGGGGIYNNYAGTLTLSDTTVTANISRYNSGAGSGGGIWNGNTLTLHNSIVAGNTASSGADIHGSITTDNGYNLLGTALINTTHGIDDQFTDTPLLSALGDYGGPTPTMAPLPGSLALTVFNDPTASTTDQRGESVPASYYRDIGAFQSQGFAVAIQSGDHQSVPVNTAFAPLVVSVTANNAIEPVAGGVITFYSQGGGDMTSPNATPSPSYATVQTGGTASDSSLSADDNAGSYTVSASADGFDSATFHLTNTPASNPLVVTTTADNGSNSTPISGSLRAAIVYADSNGGTITFQIPTSDNGYNGTAFTIQPRNAALPSISGGASIDGTSEASYLGATYTSPIIVIDGAQVGASPMA